MLFFVVKQVHYWKAQTNDLRLGFARLVGVKKLPVKRDHHGQKQF